MTSCWSSRHGVRARNPNPGTDNRRGISLPPPACRRRLFFDIASARNASSHAVSFAHRPFNSTRHHHGVDRTCCELCLPERPWLSSPSRPLDVTTALPHIALAPQPTTAGTMTIAIVAPWGHTGQPTARPTVRPITADIEAGRLRQCGSTIAQPINGSHADGRKHHAECEQSREGLPQTEFPLGQPLTVPEIAFISVAQQSDDPR